MRRIYNPLSGKTYEVATNLITEPLADSDELKDTLPKEEAAQRGLNRLVSALQQHPKLSISLAVVCLLMFSVVIGELGEVAVDKGLPPQEGSQQEEGKQLVNPNSLEEALAKRPTYNDTEKVGWFERLFCTGAMKNARCK